MIHQYNAVIRVESGQARGFVNAGVAALQGTGARFAATMAARLSGTVPMLNPQGSYVETVVGLLDQIQRTADGLQLMSALLTAGNNIVITMPIIGLAITCHRTGASPNTARTGGGDNFYRPIGQPLAAQQHEVLQAYNSALLDGVTAADLSASFCAATLATGLNITATAALITGWCTGVVPLPQDITFHFLLCALERWLQPGAGSATRIQFDPWNELTGASHRPADVGLFHELVHAYANTQGQQLFLDDQTPNEFITIGIRPFDRIATRGGARPFTENSYRRQRGLPDRPGL
ncbi:M91 family zinc metallopeptidase [Sorangium sp. So ce1000]|uniref:M91 family zinc metallopeptidase n=1 Tax=Sorangium sp. So ce1000 TaxID=3133325 RepID=UPI003F63A523